MHPIQKAKQSVGALAFTVAFIFLFAITVQLLIISVLSVAVKGLVLSPTLQTAIGSASLYCVAMPLSLPVFCRITPVLTPAKKRVSVGTWITAFAACFFCSNLLSYLGVWVSDLIAWLTSSTASNHLSESSVASPMWANLLFLVVLAPVFEEIFLRKFVIDRLLPFGELPAILISGIAFGVVHGNFYQLFYACASGFLFGFIYVKTGSLAANISLHAALNLWGAVLTAEAEKWSTGNDWNGILHNPSAASVAFSVAHYLLLAASAIICLVSLIRYLKSNQQPPLHRNPSPFSRYEWLSILFKNPLVWFFLAVSALLFLI